MPEAQTAWCRFPVDVLKVERGLVGNIGAENIQNTVANYYKIMAADV